MNEVRKEKLRILNLVEEIKDRGVAQLSLDVSHYKSGRLTVYMWAGNEILHQLDAWGDPNLLDSLKRVRLELEQMVADGIKQAREVA